MSEPTPIKSEDQLRKEIEEKVRRELTEEQSKKAEAVEEAQRQEKEIGETLNRWCHEGGFGIVSIVRPTGETFTIANGSDIAIMGLTKFVQIAIEQKLITSSKPVPKR